MEIRAPSAAQRRGSVGIVVHTTASEVESVNGGKTTARSSFLIQEDTQGRRSSVLGLPSSEALAAGLRATRRCSIGVGVMLQEPMAKAKANEHQNGDEDEDEVWDGRDSDTEDSECAKDPLAPERLTALAEMLDHMIKNTADCISQEQAALLQRIVQSAACLLKERKLVEDQPMKSQAVEVTEDLDAGSTSPARHQRRLHCSRSSAVARHQERLHCSRTADLLTDTEQACNSSRARAESHPDVQFRPAPRPGRAEHEENENDEGILAARPRQNRRFQTLTSFPAQQTNPEKGAAYFKQFLEAKQIVDIESSFRKLMTCCEVRNGEAPYASMSRLPGLPWKAAKIWPMFKAQAEKEDYKNQELAGHNVAVVGAGPVGLRVAMELALSGASVTVIEKRGEFVRINRLHLWDWVKQDLIAWGAKLFYPPGGTFGADKDYCHIGISELQTLLMKCCLLLGVDLELGVEFEGTNFVNGRGWALRTSPSLVQGSRLCVNAVVCCDGAASRIASGYGARTISGGLGKEGQAIGVVANFMNKRTKGDRDLRQFSWARQFNVPLFTKVKNETGADLENIVYYRGEENHYLIMTPSKRCLIDAGCLKTSEPEGIPLLHASNVELDNLQEFAKSVASHFDLPTVFTPTQSVMAFDFSDTHRHEQAVIFVNADGSASPLPVCLAGDALLEPFWPTGLGCVRGFLSALDCVSNLKKWVETGDPDAVLRYSDASYSQLKSVDGQTKDAILKPDHEWRLNPSTRYRGFKA